MKPKALPPAPLLLLALLAACGTQPSKPSLTRQSYPATPPSYTGLPSTRPTTSVLTQFAGASLISYNLQTGVIVAATSQALPMRKPGELGSMKLDQISSATVQTGNILVSAPNPAAPYGFMRKVKSLSHNYQNQTVTLQTTPATLAEVIAGSDLTKEQVRQTSFRVPVKMAVVAKPKAGVGVQSNSSSQTPGTLPQLPQYLTPETAKELSTQGWDFFPIGTGEKSCSTSKTELWEARLSQTSCINMQMWFTATIDIGWWWWFPYLKGFGTWANAYANVSNTMNFSIDQPITSIEVALPGGINQRMIDTPMPSSIFWVGPIPIVLTPKFVLDMSLGGSLTGSLNAGVGANASVRSSLPELNLWLASSDQPLQYGFYCGNTVNNGYWGCRSVNNSAEKIEALRSQFEAWRPLNKPIDATASLGARMGIAYKGTLSLQAGMYLYGMVGLAAAFEPYIEPQMNANVNFNIADLNQSRVQLGSELYAGADGRVFAGANIFGTNYTTDVILIGNILPRRRLFDFSRCWQGSELKAC
jgi:hypothetical protein